MAKASLTLPNGTKIILEGTPEEVQRLLELYSGATPTKPTSSKKGKRKKAITGETTPKAGKTSESPDLSKIINLVKTCDEAESIEENILDRTSLVDRTLLPLYIVHEHLENAYGLTSGDINKITTDLGIPIATPNASITLSKTASRYVIGDQVRKKGRTIYYKLSRRGVQYLKTVLSGNKDEV